ncbi:unnamed protein product [Adineta steineri]|uniref:Innexin n=1 Tax=Adineta steineri TaxID=433720 RepID=A0A814RGH3_9BILA|nr:unnamed protein product [Adineta steineri]CAF3799785.1 unnamed protein product [Adineta steineri]CAF4027220.1 unnamed protein product [Adineta steineri]
MIYLLLESIHAKFSSMSFGMDDKVDRIIRKTTIFIILVGSVVIASNRYFGIPISCSTTELPSAITQHWIDTLCWLNDKERGPVQIVGNSRLKISTSFYQFTVETLIITAFVLSIPGQVWRAILGSSGFKLKRVAAHIAAAKEATGCERTTYIKELANGLQTTRRYHRLHWNFDQLFRKRLYNLHFIVWFGENIMRYASIEHPNVHWPSSSSTGTVRHG